MEGDKKVVTQGTKDNGSDMNKRTNANRRPGSRDAQDEQRKQGTANKDYKKDGMKTNRNNGNAGNNGNNQNRTYKNDRYDKNKSYNGPKFSGKDEDDEDLGRRSKPSRPKESKSGVAIPDKNKVMLRHEKEQKSMKKKQQSKKKESNRPQPKQKRSNNINYTKNYANGDYEDYYDI